MHTLKKHVYDILKKHIVYIVHGPEGSEAFAMFEGTAPLARYSKLYLRTQDKVSVRRKLVLNRQSATQRLLRDHGMVVSRKADLTAGHALNVPDFVCLTIKLPADIQTFYNRLPNSARYDVRKIEQGRFRSEVSTDTNSVDDFYHNYYKPTMQIRHGQEAFILPLSKVKALMQTGEYEFLKVFDGDKCVAMVFAQIQPERYYYSKVGWLNGDDSQIKSGATAAMYWFAVQRAYELKLPELFLGGTPAYIENGVFKYKTKWHAGFLSQTFGLKNLYLNPDNPSCYRFLQQVSPIALNNKGEHMVLSAKSKANAGFTGPILQEINHWYILRDEKAESYTDDLTDLPEHLRYWYQRSD